MTVSIYKIMQLGKHKIHYAITEITFKVTAHKQN